MPLNKETNQLISMLASMLKGTLLKTGDFHLLKFLCFSADQYLGTFGFIEYFYPIIYTHLFTKPI